jgi:hypothetical protein
MIPKNIDSTVDSGCSTPLCSACSDRYFITPEVYEAVCDAIVMLQVFDDCMRKRMMPAGLSPCRKKVDQIINTLKNGNTPKSDETE